MAHPDYEHIGSPVIRFIEECSEIIKVACKGDRFGWDLCHPSRSGTNLQELKSEWADVQLTFDRLLEHIAKEGA